MTGCDYVRFAFFISGSQHRFGTVPAPAPGVAKPERWEEMQRRRIGPAIGRGRANQNVVRLRFGVFDLDVEKAVLRQRARFPKLEFAFHL